MTNLTFAPAAVTKEDTRRGGKPGSGQPNPFKDAVKGLTPGDPNSALSFTFDLPDARTDTATPDLRKLTDVSRYADQLDAAGEGNEPRVTVRKKFTVPENGKVQCKFWVEAYKERKKRAAKPTDTAATEDTTDAADTNTTPAAPEGDPAAAAPGATKSKGK